MLFNCLAFGKLLRGSYYWICIFLALFPLLPFSHPLGDMKKKKKRAGGVQKKKKKVRVLRSLVGVQSWNNCSYKLLSGVLCFVLLVFFFPNLVASVLVLSALSYFHTLSSYRSPPQPSLSQADEEEITWGSDELPIESVSQERVNKGKDI